MSAYMITIVTRSELRCYIVHDIECPYCFARPDEPCIRERPGRSDYLRKPHRARVKADPDTSNT